MLFVLYTIFNLYRMARTNYRKEPKETEKDRQGPKGTKKDRKGP